MTEERFMYFEHKGADYILDNPNTELDFIEMLGDCLEPEEIVDLLNNYDVKLTEIEEIIKDFDDFWTRVPKGYCSNVNGAYIVMKKMLETIRNIKEEINND